MGEAVAFGVPTSAKFSNVAGPISKGVECDNPIDPQTGSSSQYHRLIIGRDAYDEVRVLNGPSLFFHKQGARGQLVLPRGGREDGRNLRATDAGLAVVWNSRCNDCGKPDLIYQTAKIAIVCEFYIDKGTLWDGIWRDRLSRIPIKKLN